jgi:hypothetical protein
MRSRNHPVDLRYLELVASVERCVRKDIDHQALPPLDPMPIMEWLRSLAGAMHVPAEKSRIETNRLE